MADEPGFGRRELLSGRFLRGIARFASEAVERRVDAAREGAAAARTRGDPDGRRPTVVPVLRPPHAVPEAEFLAGCTKCGGCILACPHDSVVPAPDRFGVAAGTPMIDVSRQPCWMCEDRPCVESCEPRVLRRELPAKMGMAWIILDACLAHQGTTCSTCRERCPVPGALRVEKGRPVIVDDECTGCGVCHHVCPASRNAVIILPRKPS